MKQRLALLLVVAVLLLTGCSNQAPIKLSDYGSFSQVECKDVPKIIVAIKYADTTPEGTNPNKELNEWLPTGMTADEAIRVLNDRCPESTPTPSMTPRATETTSPSPAPTNTATASPTATSTTSTYYSSATTHWGDIVDNPPAGLREKVEQNSTRLQFSWADVRIWANANKPDGSKGDARVIVIVGNDELTKGRQDRARREVGLEGASVHVIAADSLTTVDGERLQGTQVILAPLKMESDGIAKEFRRFQSGIAFTEKGSLSPVLIQGVQLPPRP